MEVDQPFSQHSKALKELEIGGERDPGKVGPKEIGVFTAIVSLMLSSHDILLISVQLRLSCQIDHISRGCCPNPWSEY